MTGEQIELIWDALQAGKVEALRAFQVSMLSDGAWENFIAVDKQINHAMDVLRWPDEQPKEAPMTRFDEYSHYGENNPPLKGTDEMSRDNRTNHSSVQSVSSATLREMQDRGMLKTAAADAPERDMPEGFWDRATEVRHTGSIEAMTHHALKIHEELMMVTDRIEAVADRLFGPAPAEADESGSASVLGSGSQVNTLHERLSKLSDSVGYLRRQVHRLEDL